MRDQEPDHQLMERLKQNDPTAFEVLYNRYAPRLLGIIRYVIHDANESEDVLQNVFLYVWRKSHLYRAERGSVEAYLMQITKSRVIDHMRMRRRRHETYTDELPAGSERTVVQDHDPLYANELLNRLSDHERRTIELMVFGGFTQREIAAALHIPLGTVKSWTRRGLAKLRRHLAREGQGDDDASQR